MPGLEAVSPAVQALALLWLLVAVNLLGVRAGGGVQIVTTVLKLLPMAAIILLGAWLLVTEPAVYARHPPATPITLEGLMAASTIALFAMLGIESAAVPAGRVRDPERTIPRATMVGTLLTAAIYIAVSSIALLLIQQEELAQSSAPFADLLDRFMGAGNGRVLSIFVVISGLGALNGWTLLVSELTASLGRHGFLPRPRGAPELARRTGRGAAVDGRRSPRAMVLMNYSKSLVEGFTFLTLVVTAANLPLYLFCAIALVVLARRGVEQAARRPARAGPARHGVFGVRIRRAGARTVPVVAGARGDRPAVVLADAETARLMRRHASDAGEGERHATDDHRRSRQIFGVVDCRHRPPNPAAPRRGRLHGGRSAAWRTLLRAPRRARDRARLASRRQFIAYPGRADLAIKAWRTPHRGEALWILSGIHGEEPAGPNAIARSLPSLVSLSRRRASPSS